MKPKTILYIIIICLMLTTVYSQIWYKDKLDNCEILDGKTVRYEDILYEYNRFNNECCTYGLNGTRIGEICYTYQEVK